MSVKYFAARAAATAVVSMVTNMPKKKKGGKKKGKGKGAKGEEEGKEGEVEAKPYEAPASTERELALRSELNELDSELSTLKKQVQDLRSENEWLMEEAERTKTESQDYQTYISRKAQKRQSLVVSLSDHNRAELRRIQREKEELLRDFEEKKTGLSATLLEKQSELAKVQRDLQGLEPYTMLRREQEDEIARLEQQLEELKFNHEDRVRSIKTRFLREKREYEKMAEARIRSMAEKASKDASRCLQEHTQHVRTENLQLRLELKHLIDTSNNLQHQKRKLEVQYHTLLQESQLGHAPLLARGRRGVSSLPSAPRTAGNGR